MPLNDQDFTAIIKQNKTIMNLEKLGITSEYVLLRSQLATILGGVGDATLESSEGGTCGYRSLSGVELCNITKDQAKGFADSNGGYWCCDSCGSTSYC